jgi:two-component system, cell cycle sensor histidine kinase and response regulator CckA
VVEKLVVVSRDVTDRIKLEGQLRQLQKMESLGQLAGGVAHDFNNMLTVIQGHTSQLLTRENLPVKLAETLRQISSSAEMAANLTRQLLMFSRQQTMQPTNLDLNDVIYNLTKMLRRILGEDIKLQFEGATELPMVYADQGMVGQILMNLSVNSRDAMPKGGQLTIATAVVEIDRAYMEKNPEAHSGKFVRLSVSDTGCGIPPENVSHVFEPFFTTKEAGKGTGLGLATVYGIVRQHHGWITLQSSLGTGTTFSIFLPVSVQRPVPAAQKKLPAKRVSGGNETILIVEDLLPLRELLRAILESYGYRILEAPTGVMAMDVWREHQEEIDLLLTDMVMPDGISGNELADRLQSEKPTLRVIYTSGHGPAAFSNIVLEEGRNFVQKPYQPQKLAETIRNALDAAVAAAS